MAEAGEESQFVTLCLAAEVFAVPVSMVREILEYRDPFHIPDGPAFMQGLIDVRGLPVPVIDLRVKLGLPAAEISPLTRIMVVDVPLADRTLSLGLMADKVLEVASFQSSEISDAPDVGIRWRSDYISGVVRREEGFVVLFNLPKLLTTSEIAALPEEEEAAGVVAEAEAEAVAAAGENAEPEAEVSAEVVADTAPETAGSAGEDTGPAA